MIEQRIDFKKGDQTHHKQNGIIYDHISDNQKE